MTATNGSGEDPEVCVVGAGPVGGALACLLAARGIATAVIDRAALPPMEHPDFDGRAYAIAAGSRAARLRPVRRVQEVRAAEQAAHSPKISRVCDSSV